MGLENNLHVVSCALLKLYGQMQGSYRPEGRKDWHILYIIEGKGFVTIDGEVIECKPGTVILYPPYVPQKYAFHKDIKTKYFYIHFDGDMCEELLGKLNERIYFIGINAQLEDLFYRLAEDFALKLPYYESITCGLLLSIISLIVREINYMSYSPADSKNKIIEICRQMQVNFGKKISIGEYADMCNLSESRFSHLFKEIMDVSPIQYMLDIRIQKAKQLLEDTDLPISTISDMTGMQSQHYFSRIFKKYTSLSPSEYRQSTQ